MDIFFIAIQLLKTKKQLNSIVPMSAFLINTASNGRSLDQLQTPSLELKNLQNLKPCPTGELQHLRSGKAGKTSKEARGNWMQPRFPTYVFRWCRGAAVWGNDDVCYMHLICMHLMVFVSVACCRLAQQIRAFMKFQ